MAKDEISLRRYLDERRNSLRRDRYSYWQHWQELSQYLLPRRYKWLITPNQANRGSPLNASIVNPTGTLAARQLAAGMLSGICSPSRPWFKLGLLGQNFDRASPEQAWLYEVEARMMLILQDSNFYDAMGVVFFDLVVFGTAANIIFEDYEDIIRCYVACPGEYYLTVDSNNRPNGLYREFAKTIGQVVEEFGIENCSDTVKSMAQSASNLSSEIIIFHAIEKNSPRFGVPDKFKWVDCYWEAGSSQHTILRKRGFYEQPFMAPRWDVGFNDAYGRSVAMDALPDIRQLQHHSRRKAQGIDKIVTPPMIADISMKNRPASMLPGGVTYVAGLSNGNVGFKPAYSINLPLNDLREDIADIEQRIRDTFFNNLFMTVTNLDTVRSATEIDARRAEQLVMLGPVLERFDKEALTPVLERLYSIMYRLKLLPEPPPSIAGNTIQIRFQSMLAESQRAASAAGVERWLMQLGALGAVDATTMDRVKVDEVAPVYGSLMAVPPRLLRNDEELEELRQRRAEEQQQAALLQQTLPAARGAKVLAETNIGGGQSALATLLGGG